jgi:formate-dependent nitrite reductase membrane component NrfD
MGARTTLNTAHPRPWGWRVTTYLWTKGVAAGALLVAALAMILSADLGVLGTVVAPAVALVGLLATAVLLVTDLKRPDRFLYILLKPNPTSWLFLGGVVLAICSAVAGLWFLAGLAHELDLFDASGVLDVLRWLAIPAAIMTAGYTGFLFNQAEGRDLWQSPLLFWHLQVQALMIGAGALAVAMLFADASADGERLIVRTLVLATLAHVAVLALEFGGRHATRHAAAAAHLVTHGPYARLFWLVGVGLALVAAALAALSWSGEVLIAAAVAGLLVQIVLLAYESVFVRAGQDIPLS